MRVTVVTYGFMTRITPQTGRPAEVDLPEGATITMLIAALGVDSEDISLVMINGRRSNKDALLAPGDQVRLFAPIGGG